MHERIISARKKIKYKKHRNKNTKMNRRKLQCATIIKKSKKYARAEDKKTSLKKPKKIQKTVLSSTFNFIRQEEILIIVVGAGAGWSIPATQVPISALF